MQTRLFCPMPCRLAFPVGRFQGFGDLRCCASNRPLFAPRPEPMRRTHAKHVAFASAPQIPLDIAYAIDVVGCNPAEGHSRRDRTFDHPGGNLRLRRKADIGRYMRRLHARRIFGPTFRQVERAVNERVAPTRHVGGKHPDLAVGDLARRACVLPTDATGTFALFQKTRFINDQNRIGSREILDDIVAHNIAQRIAIPSAATQNSLPTPGPYRLQPLPASSRSSDARPQGARLGTIPQISPRALA